MFFPIEIDEELAGKIKKIWGFEDKIGVGFGALNHEIERCMAHRFGALPGYDRVVFAPDAMPEMCEWLKVPFSNEDCKTAV